MKKILIILVMISKMNSNDDKLICKIQMDGIICDHCLLLFFFCSRKKSNKHIRLFYSYSTECCLDNKELKIMRNIYSD